MLINKRFYNICTLDHWYTKYKLIINPEMFNLSGSSLYFNDKNVYVCNPIKFIKYNDSNKLKFYSGYIWKKFNCLDVSLPNNIDINRNGKTIKALLDITLKYFSSFEISPISKDIKDTIYLDRNVFGNNVYDNITHLSLNGNVCDISDKTDDVQLKTNFVFMFDIFPNILYLELNYVWNIESNWIENVMNKLDKVIVLDIWRCKWRNNSTIKINKNIEIFRIYDSTIQTIFNLDYAINLRFIVAGIDMFGYNVHNNLLQQISKLNKNKSQIIHIGLTHSKNIDNLSILLQQMNELNIESVNIIYTEDMYRNTNINSIKTIKHSKLNIIFNKFSQHLYVSSKNYKHYKKFKNIGKLSGTLSW